MENKSTFPPSLSDLDDAASPASPPPIRQCAKAAPGIIDLLDRMGVPFNRTPEGLLDFSPLCGTLYNRTAFPARPQAANCCTHTPTGEALRSRRQGQEVRALGISFPLCSIPIILPGNLRHGFAVHGSPHFPGRRFIWPPGQWCDLRTVYEFRGVVRFRAIGAISARCYYRKRRIYPSFIPPAFRREDKLRLMSNQPAEKADASGCRKRPATNAISNPFRRASAVLPGRVVSEVRQPGARDYATRAIHKVVYSTISASMASRWFIST